MHPRLAELVEYVEAQRTALLSVAARVPVERWTERPAPDRWSLAELFEHLARVEQSCARVIAKRVTEARAAGHPAETESTSLRHALDGVGLTDRSTKRQAPERVAPTGTLTGPAARTALSNSRRELRDAVRAADGLALGGIRHPHARLGDINLYQWVLFVGQHEERHVQQAIEIGSQLATTVG